MTKGQRSECMRLLSHAKRGDEFARQKLVDAVSQCYRGMVRRFYSHDPILGREDINSEFYWGIWRGVDEVDHRGDPIFHLAQRGLWSVKSLVSQVNRRRHGTIEKEGGISVVSLDSVRSEHGDEQPPEWEPIDDSVASDPQGVVEIHERRTEARERVIHVLVNASLAPRHEEILQILLSGDVDLQERLSRKELANKLGVSGQRVSQLVSDMSTRIQAADEQ